MSDKSLLRQAARAMREDHGRGHPRHAMWDAMAMLLDAHDHLRRSGSLFDAATERTADLVAETYLDARESVEDEDASLAETQPAHQVCRHCEQEIREDDGYYTAVRTLGEGGTGEYCSTGPGHDHEPQPPALREVNYLELRDTERNLLWRTTVTWDDVVRARAALRSPDIGGGR
jgi:hypothetical protein